MDDEPDENQHNDQSADHEAAYVPVTREEPTLRHEELNIRRTLWFYQAGLPNSRLSRGG
jgi:hypothetical protein